MGYDLHTHSIYSDGTLKPKELILKGIECGLDGLALTDHDSVAGIEEAAIEAERTGFTFIPGIELTTDYGAVEVHILGYDFDYYHHKLRQKLEAIEVYRIERARLIVKKLNKARIPLSWEKVENQATGRFIGRSHIFRALQVTGLIPQGKEYFEYYLGKTGIAYVPHQEIGTFEAIDLINETGGIPVLAHPGRMGNERLIAKLVEHGLKGIEVFYPNHDLDLIAHYQKLAQRFNLYITGGSDYHGALGETRLGAAQVMKISEWFHPNNSRSKISK